MYKQNFEEILENVQQQILSHFDVTEEDLETATEAFKDDPEIAKLVTELETLYLGKRETKEEEEGVILLCDYAPSGGRLKVHFAALFLTFIYIHTHTHTHYFQFIR